MSAEERSGKQGHSGGLFVSVRMMADTLIAIVQTRVELLSTELEEERIRLTSMLVWGFVALFCASLGIIFVTMLFVLSLWDDHRLLAAGIPAAVFLSAALFSVRTLVLKIQSKPRLFSASLAELNKDREQLGSRHE